MSDLLWWLHSRYLNGFLFLKFSQVDLFDSEYCYNVKFNTSQWTHDLPFFTLLFSMSFFRNSWIKIDHEGQLLLIMKNRYRPILFWFLSWDWYRQINGFKLHTFSYLNGNICKWFTDCVFVSFFCIRALRQTLKKKILSRNVQKSLSLCSKVFRVWIDRSLLQAYAHGMSF